MVAVTQTLSAAGISPSAQRIAVAKIALASEDHPSADEVWRSTQEIFPKISRATIYNTLNLMVAKGLLRQLVLTEGKVVFDPKLEPHHHLVDESTGRIHDIPWSALSVDRVDQLDGYDVYQYQVVLRGRRFS